jgi:hypothetical protein
MSLSELHRAGRMNDRGASNSPLRRRVRGSSKRRELCPGEYLERTQLVPSCVPVQVLALNCIERVYHSPHTHTHTHTHTFDPENVWKEYCCYQELITWADPRGQTSHCTSCGHLATNAMRTEDNAPNRSDHYCTAEVSQDWKQCTNQKGPFFPPLVTASLISFFLHIGATPSRRGGKNSRRDDGPNKKFEF